MNSYFSELSKLKEKVEKVEFPQLKKLFEKNYELVSPAIACTMVGLISLRKKEKKDIMEILVKLDVQLFVTCIWLKSETLTYLPKSEIIKTVGPIKILLNQLEYHGTSDDKHSILTELNTNIYLIKELETMVAMIAKSSTPTVILPLLLSMMIRYTSCKLDKTPEEILADMVSWQSYFLEIFDTLKKEKLCLP